MKEIMNVEETIQNILSGNLVTLAKTLTKIESEKREDRLFVNEVLFNLRQFTGNSFRLGITGNTGTGKSTFIDKLGIKLCDLNKKVAVIAIEKRSVVSFGSILGDSTRMVDLLHHSNSFIRPIPTNNNSFIQIFEAMLLCEAAGYEYIIIESAEGVDNEVIRDMVDCMVLLTTARSGDELQGIKRGILELVDFLLINKCDEDLSEASHYSATSLTHTMKLLTPPTTNWNQKVMAISSKTGFRMNEVISEINNFKDTIIRNAYKKEIRINQMKKWIHRSIQNRLINTLILNESFQTQIYKYEDQLINGENNIEEVADELLQLIIKK